MSLLSQTKRFIWRLSADNHQTPSPQDKLVVGVSGGADSIALLTILTKIYRADQLVVAHLYHGLRETADIDLTHVQTTAAALNLPFYSKKVDIAQNAKTTKQTIEEAGRNARYTFFAEIAKEVGATFIAVGHHADDQAETVLFNLMRGAGLKGIGGMLPMRKQGDLTIFRPLLFAKKAELLAYCDKHEHAYITDETNVDTTYTRNRIRQDLVPSLEGYNPHLVDHLTNLATVAQADEALLNDVASEKFTELVDKGNGFSRFPLYAWRSLSVGLQRRVLRLAVSELLPDGTELSFATLEAARAVAQLGNVGAAATLPAGLVLRVGYDGFVVGGITADIPSDFPQLLSDEIIPLPIGEPVALDNGYWITAKYTQTFTPSEDTYTVTIATTAPLFLRSRTDGERMQPFGMDGKSTPIKKIMINQKMPATARAQWPIVATASHPIWIIGHTLDHRARVKNKSERYLRLVCHR